jgi:N6-adenosine-specific RNA methylase IME4
MTVTVDQEFAALCPPLTPEEYAELETSIIREGCRDALVVWKNSNVLLDGHNRKRICETHGLSYDTKELDLPDRDTAIVWILGNQLARRNLTDDQRAIKAAELAERLAAQAKRERAQAAVRSRDWHPVPAPILGIDVMPKIKAPKEKSSAKAAKQGRISQSKVEKAQTVLRKRPDLAQKIATGELGLASAMREIKRADVVADLECIETKQAKALDGVYDVIVIDPPWPMQRMELEARPNAVAMPYPVMQEYELRALSIPYAEDCHVWLWTTHRFMPLALDLLDAWGLKYVCTFVWHKDNAYQPLGLPKYNCEFALYARRGAPVFIDLKAFNVCFNAASGAHSEKPSAFYDTVRRVTAGRRLDMFARRAIEGFDAWGNEV